MISIGMCIDHVHEVLKGKAKQSKPPHPLPALMAKRVGVARFPLYSMLNPSSASHTLPFPCRLFLLRAHKSRPLFSYTNNNRTQKH
jgi:hypothetical protein